MPSVSEFIRSHPPRVAEVQGWDGPFVFSELLLQKVWRRGLLRQGGWRTWEGVPIEVRAPGRWNRLAGPDFLGARLRMAGTEIVGDVELHLHAEDWEAHAHAEDPAYRGVVLHAVLFPPREGWVTRDGAGRPIPTLVLLPLLPHDLESLAWDEAAELLAARDEDTGWAEWASLSPEDRLRQVEERGRLRWEEKVRQAASRLRTWGWEGACHATALEILGQRRNRWPMLQVAERWPLARWRLGLDEAWERTLLQDFTWQRHGVRPLNQPRRRLAQYGAWVQRVPDWPERVRRLERELEAELGLSEVGEWRKRCRLNDRRDAWCQAVTAGTVPGGRWDSLVCDGWLPLLGASGCRVAESWWNRWSPGEMPARFGRALVALGLAQPPRRPITHGLAQGLWHWWSERQQTGWLVEEPGGERAEDLIFGQ